MPTRTTRMCTIGTRISWSPADVDEDDPLLDVMRLRYGASSLHGKFGPRFVLTDQVTEAYRTPLDTIQQFVYGYCDFVR